MQVNMNLAIILRQDSMARQLLNSSRQRDSGNKGQLSQQFLACQQPLQHGTQRIT